MNLATATPTSPHGSSSQVSGQVPIRVLVCTVLGLMLLGWTAWAAQPKIDFIEKYLSSQILVHYDVPANAKYRLEYTGNLGSNGLPSGPWTGLYTNPVIPFENHYIVPDWRTNKQRFYRLRIIP